MTQLHQVLAAEKSIKEATHKIFTAALAAIQKPAQLAGLKAGDALLGYVFNADDPGAKR